MDLPSDLLLVWPQLDRPSLSGGPGPWLRVRSAPRVPRVLGAQADPGAL